MKYRTRKGSTAQRGSQNGWAGLPKEQRVCVRCGGPVTLQHSSTEHTQDGATSVWHWRCP